MLLYALVLAAPFYYLLGMGGCTTQWPIGPGCARRRQYKEKVVGGALSYIFPLLSAPVARFLYHLHVNRNTRRKREVRQCFYNFLIRIQNINNSFVHPHLKLFSRVFIDKGCAVDGVSLEFGRKRDRTNNRRVQSIDGIYNLFQGCIEKFVLISLHPNAKFYRNLFRPFFYSFFCRCTFSTH